MDEGLNNLREDLVVIDRDVERIRGGYREGALIGKNMESRNRGD